VNYPVSCIPQAWAAASAHLVLRTLLGLKPDFENQRMVIDPFLPAQFEAISVAGLAAFGERFDLAVHVHEEHYHVSPSGQVEIVVAGEETDR
jgi:glycogen debranching enzyme